MEELEKLKGDKKLPFKVLFRRTLTYLKPEWVKFLLAGLMILINVGRDVILPLFLGQITNTLSETMTRSDINYIVILSVSYLAICLINQVFLYFESMLLQHAGQNIIYNLRMQVFVHIENMSQNQFDEMPVGSLVTRVASYTQSMSDLFTNVLVNIIRNVLTVVGVYAIMIFLSPVLALILSIFVAIVFVTSFVFGKIVGKIFRNERKYISDLNTYLNENLSGMKLTQIFNQEKYKEYEFIEKNEALRKARYKVVVAFGIYRPFITLL